MDAQRSRRILQITDPHLFADESATLYGVTTARSFAAVLDRATGDEHQPVDAIFVTGDIAEDHSEGAYLRLKGMLETHELPVFCIPGNHDHPGTMQRVLDVPPFQCGGSAEIGAWHCIFLDSHWPREDRGRIIDAELARLQVELEAAAGRFVLVCVHHQLLPMGSQWLDAYGVENAGEVLGLLEHYANVRAVLWGHVHQASDRWHGDIRMLSTPSTCAQFTPSTDRCVMDVRPPGFRWLDLMPTGDIRTEVVWLDDWTVTERPPDSYAKATKPAAGPDGSG